MFLRILICTVFLAAPVTTLAAEKPCKTINAHYVSASSPLYKLDFVDLKGKEEISSDVGIHIQNGIKGEEIWYFFDQGTTARISLISTTDLTVKDWHSPSDGDPRPHGVAQFIAMDLNGKIPDQPPKADSIAPHYIIIPEFVGGFRFSKSPYSPSAFVFEKCTGD
ncbi:hypothetical protein UCD39_01690 [Nitrospirillum sp. BR 11752]|uniref:hypothetical protein n=1 Tax=Nitrospirillum sp. BR 11752 TaxID=3104293 RepID=UPI002EA2859D|nr:hypothetical protein [Nitrospirillum sp. BR 11752]